MIESLLGSKKLWSLCSHEDSFVRRSVYNLVRSAVSKVPEELDWNTISAAIIGKSLQTSQTGSSAALSEALLQISSSRPQVWTDYYTGKSSSSKRLLQYIQKGSQGGLGSFWANLSRLLRIIPLQVLSRIGQDTDAEKISLSSASTLAEAFQDGLNSRDEPRDNRAVGWKFYIDTGIWLSTLLPDDDKQKLVRERISPLLGQYVAGSSDQPRWALPVQSAEPICVHCFAALAINGHGSALKSLWADLSDRLLETIKLSPPEQSKDFKSSQDSICAQSKRFFSLETAVLNKLQGVDAEAQTVSIFENTGMPLVENCLQVLRSRMGKPYGAASVVKEGVRSIPRALRHSQELLAFFRQDVPELLLSPSADHLVTTAISCHRWDGFELGFKDMVEHIFRLEPEQSNVPVLTTFLSAVDFREIEDLSGLNSLITKAMKESQWPIITTVIRNQTLPRELAESVFSSVTDSLSDDDTAPEFLHGLLLVSSSAPSATQEFQTGPNGSKLAGKLLYLTESSSEETSGLAETLLKTLKKTTVGDVGAKSGLEILQHNFNHTTDESLS